MKTLFLAWQDSAVTRTWFPIGQLDADMVKSRFRFGYTHGAEMAHRKVGFAPLDSFPKFNDIYESSELFPLFRNRIVGEERTDFREYLRQLDLNPDETNPLDILALTGGERQTDNLEVFPKIERHKDGNFRYRFLLHGWRHVNQAAQRKLLELQTGQELRVAIELNNPSMEFALQLYTPNDYHMVGWAPRYLVGDLCRAMSELPSNIQAEVIKINPAPAPTKQRVLVELRGRWPAKYKPMSTPEFQLLKSR